MNAAVNPPIKLRFPGEPISTWNVADFDALLLWAVAQKASDIDITTGRHVRARVHGEWYRVTARKITNPADIDRFIGHIDADTVPPLVRAGAPENSSYRVRSDRLNFQRFRVNYTSVDVDQSHGIAANFRVIPGHPPEIEVYQDLEDQIRINQEGRALALPEAIMRIVQADNGLVLFVGRTGTGKTTTLAALERRMLETRAIKLVTLEDPIEFDLQLDDLHLDGTPGEAQQSDIGGGGHISTWALGVKSLSRRAVDVTLIGELNDNATIRAAVDYTQTGVLTLSTLHTDGVAATLGRIVGGFEGADARAIFAGVVPHLRWIVYQRLIPPQGPEAHRMIRPGETIPTRLPLFEYLELGADHRNTLLGASIEEGELYRTMDRMLWDSGRPLAKDAKRYLDAGMFTQDQYDEIVNRRQEAS